MGGNIEFIGIVFRLSYKKKKKNREPLFTLRDFQCENIRFCRHTKKKNMD